MNASRTNERREQYGSSSCVCLLISGLVSASARDWPPLNPRRLAAAGDSFSSSGCCSRAAPRRRQSLGDANELLLQLLLFPTQLSTVNLNRWLRQLRRTRKSFSSRDARKTNTSPRQPNRPTEHHHHHSSFCLRFIWKIFPHHLLAPNGTSSLACCSFATSPVRDSRAM